MFLLLALVTLSVENQAIRFVVALIQAQSELRFVLPERLAERKVTLSLRGASPETAALELARAAGLRLRTGQQKGVYLITDR